jgi:PAS domain S-box-containing protein
MPHHIGRGTKDQSLPVLTDVPTRVPHLLPNWERPGTMSGIATFDGYLVAMNTGYSDVLGWSGPDLMCAPFWEFVHPDDRDRTVEWIDGLIREGGVRTGHEMRLLCRDGSYRWTRWDALADLDSELRYGVGVDISRRKLPVEEPCVLVGTWLRHIDAGTVSWSDELYVMFGLPIGAPLTDEAVRGRVHEQDLPLAESAWRESLADEDAHAANYRVVRPDGSIRRLHSTGRVVARSDGRALVVRGITVDITDGPDGQW